MSHAAGRTARCAPQRLRAHPLWGRAAGVAKSQFIVGACIESYWLQSRWLSCTDRGSDKEPVWLVDFPRVRAILSAMRPCSENTLSGQLDGVKLEIVQVPRYQHGTGRTLTEPSIPVCVPDTAGGQSARHEHRPVNF